MSWTGMGGYGEEIMRLRVILESGDSRDGARWQAMHARCVAFSSRGRGMTDETENAWAKALRKEYSRAAATMPFTGVIHQSVLTEDMS